MDPHFLRDGLAALSAAAATVTGWSLAILGGTVAGILGSDHLRPAGAIRYVYLLFVPGWGFLGASLFYGDRVARRSAACAFTNDHKSLAEIGQSMNSEYAQQRLFFELALVA